MATKPKTTSPGRKAILNMALKSLRHDTNLSERTKRRMANGIALYLSRPLRTAFSGYRVVSIKVGGPELAGASPDRRTPMVVPFHAASISRKRLKGQAI
jgi:hypothetical protein